MTKQSCLILTSIQYPTRAVKDFCSMSGHDVIVAGDAKTPDDWQCGNAKFLSLQEQERRWPELARAIPHNSYSRKNLGYVAATEGDYKVISESDDDNYPNNRGKDWKFPAFDGTYDLLAGQHNFINIYSLFGDTNIWPRGMPLDLIPQHPESKEYPLRKTACKVGVWQGLVDEDPDVDALWRLTHPGTLITFDRRPPVVLDAGTVSPYNTQNTATLRELAPLLYLPITVSFRFTDILKSFVAQPIMWLLGYRLGFVSANAVQKRNKHDLFEDFLDEIAMYKNTRLAYETVCDTVKKENGICDNMHLAYRALAKAGIVGDEEMTPLEHYLNLVCL